MNLQIALIALGVILVTTIYLLARGKEIWQSRTRKNRSRTSLSEPALGRTSTDPALDKINRQLDEGIPEGSDSDGLNVTLQTQDDPEGAGSVPHDEENQRNIFEQFQPSWEEEAQDPPSGTEPVSTGSDGETEESEADAGDQPVTVSGNSEENASDVSDESLKTEQEISPAPGFEKLSQIDYYVKLSGGRDVSRESVLAVYREEAAGILKSHSLYGLRLPDKIWSNIEFEPEEARFGDLVITIQLADGNGPLDKDGIRRFSKLVSQLSESTGRGFSFMAPMECALQQAESIDYLRRKFDSIFVINIRPLEEDHFDGGMVERYAVQVGLNQDENGFFSRFKPVDKQKVCLYSMVNMTETGEFDFENMRGSKLRGVTFFTRPAINCLPGAVFSEMADTAKAFASRINGEVAAPGYDVLTNENIESIRQTIDQVAVEMESYGIVPGSSEAIRLF